MLDGILIALFIVTCIYGITTVFKPRSPHYRLWKLRFYRHRHQATETKQVAPPVPPPTVNEAIDL